MKKSFIGKKALISAISGCVSFISFVITILSVIDETRNKTLIIIASVFIAICIISFLIAYNSSKTDILNRALKNIFSNDMPLITTTQYAYYASRYILNPHIKLTEETLSIKIIEADKPNLSYQLLDYHIVGKLKGRKSVKNIEAIFSKTLLDNFHNIDLSIVRNDCFEQPDIKFVQKDEEKFLGSNYRSYEITLNKELTPKAPYFDINIHIDYKEPISIDSSNIFFLDPTNFSSKTKNLNIDFIIQSDELINNYDIATYKLDKRTLQLKEFQKCELSTAKEVAFSSCIRNYYINFNEREQSGKISKNHLYLTQIVKRK